MRINHALNNSDLIEDNKQVISKEISLTPSIQIPKKLENINNSSPLDIYEYSNNQIDPIMIKRENNISTKTDTNNQNNGDDFEHKDLSLTINPLKRSALEIRNNHRMILSRVDGSDSGSIFRNSSNGSQTRPISYWDMLSLDDIKIHEREQEFKKEAKKRAQILLKSCLEDQMRERGLQSNISKYEEHLRDGIIIDKIKQLELEHQSKRKRYLESIERNTQKYEDKLEQEKAKLQDYTRKSSLESPRIENNINKNQLNGLDLLQIKSKQFELK